MKALPRMLLLWVLVAVAATGCSNHDAPPATPPTPDFSGITVTAADILGDPHFRAISYGGYRETTRDIQPTIAQLKEDMRILQAMGVRLLCTYNVHNEEKSGTNSQR